jgi:hypothetical protein
LRRALRLRFHGWLAIRRLIHQPEREGELVQWPGEGSRGRRRGDVDAHFFRSGAGRDRSHLDRGWSDRRGRGVAG